MTPDELAAQRITLASSRSVRKRIAVEVDGEGSVAKAAILRAARSRGVQLPDEAAEWPAKKLLRRAQGRMHASRVRRNPIARDDRFVCVSCSREVPPHGRSARDHCPHCLTGLHVDAVVPGDRASPCGGELHPIGVVHERGRWVLKYRCTRCGMLRRNQVLTDGDPPDDWEVVVALK